MAEVELTSVANGDARRTPRVDFNAQVELLARDERGDEQRVLVAQALDLGSGGIGLSMRERLPVGTKVTCRLALDGRDAALDGRVAWSRSNTSPRPHGLGVCFDGLAEHERELLAHMVDRTQAGYRPVELRFDGAQTPVIARARPTAEGLRVSTPLPMLDQGAELSVRFEGEGQAFIGRITGVSVSEQDGTRRLEVDLALSDAASVRFRRQARYGYADELTSAVGATGGTAPALRGGASSGTESEGTEDPSNTGRHRARARRVAGSVRAPAPAPAPAAAAAPLSAPAPSAGARRALSSVSGALRVTASLLLAASCGALLSAWLERSWSGLDAGTGSAPIAAEPAPTVTAESEDLGAAPAPEPDREPARELPGEHVSPDGEPNAAKLQLELPERGGATANSSQLSAPETTRGTSPALRGGEASDETPALPAETRRAEPVLVVEGGVTVVTVPYAGNLDGMQTRTWASPPAVAIDLPHGTALVEHGYYPLSGGIAAGLRVLERNHQLLVRVMLAQPVSRIAVAVQRESLEIRLTAAP